MFVVLLFCNRVPLFVTPVWVVSRAIPTDYQRKYASIHTSVQCKYRPPSLGCLAPITAMLILSAEGDDWRSSPWEKVTATRKPQNLATTDTTTLVASRDSYRV